METRPPWYEKRIRLNILVLQLSSDLHIHTYIHTQTHTHTHTHTYTHTHFIELNACDYIPPTTNKLWVVGGKNGKGGSGEDNNPRRPCDFAFLTIIKENDELQIHFFYLEHVDFANEK